MKKDKTIEKLKERCAYLAEVSNRNRPGGKSLIEEALEKLEKDKQLYKRMTLRRKFKWNRIKLIYHLRHLWGTRHEAAPFCSLSYLQHYLLYFALFASSLLNIVMTLILLKSRN